MKTNEIENILEKLKKIAEVSHLNFLFGAGTSDPFIAPLPQIEVKMDKADRGGKLKELLRLKKEFFNTVMKPCLSIRSYNKDNEIVIAKKLVETYRNYRCFLTETTGYVLARKSSLLDKQVNLFTTNIDIFIEKTLEDMGANYNDGFIGRIFPLFRTSHFQTITKKKSEYLEQQSEIPTFNLYKLHGSLTWGKGVGNSEIEYSDLVNLKDMDKYDDREFIESYDNLHIINPNQEKFATSVLRSTHYELLRLYATELEKENALLIVAGFSFADDHILQITTRAMDSNPTLSVCIICHSDSNGPSYRDKFRSIRYTN
ncbi:MAG: hypothetical protein A2Y24_02335, partial [Clostridiales bacterium GWE2_32_10]